jgi:acyl transferase domain-containing protein
VLLSKFGGLSPDGRSKAFAAGADGFGRGEGAGLVVLQPLSAAIAAGARIYCIIRGSAVNNNGLGNGLTAPSVPGQAALLREAYARAGVPTNRVHYVETHGTGTALGDPTEASALGAALGEGRAIDRPLLIGSLKANIGHLEGAAGIAGVIKVALALSRRLVPPHMLHGEPNPRIPFGELRLSLPRHTLPWPGEDGPATAGVSAFGWGGTNAHVVMEESPVGGEELLPLAADSAEELLAQAARAEELVLNRAAPVSVRDLCRTWALYAGAGGHRAAMVFRTRSDLAALLKSLRQGKRRAGLSTGEPGERPRVAFVCAPQGSEWPAMGRELLATEPVFRARVEALDVSFMPLAGWSLVERLREPHARGETDEDAAEPLTFAVQMGLAALWRSWGVEPEAVVGHGVGEVAAACIAGGMDEVDAVWKVYRASRLRQWEPLRDELEVAQERLWERASGPTWLSTLAREVGPEGRAGDARCRNPRQPVRFAQAAERLVSEGYDTFVELSPHPVLCRPVEQLLRKAVRAGVVVGSLRRDEPRASLLEALGALHARGVAVRWSALPPPESPVSALPVPTRPSGDSTRVELLPLSAQTPEALARAAHLLLARLEERPLSLHDVCYSASVHRGHLHYRLALQARNHAEARAGLGAFLRGESRPGLSSTRHADGRHQPVVFVFPGQGSQWAGMGRRLMAEEPVFRAAIEQCDAALRRHVDWSLVELLRSDSAAWMERVDQVQPALFSVQVGRGARWRGGPQHGRGGRGARGRGAEPRRRGARHLPPQPALAPREWSGRHGHGGADAGGGPRRHPGPGGLAVRGRQQQPPLHRALRGSARARPGAREAGGPGGVLPPGEGGRGLAQPADGAPARGPAARPGGPVAPARRGAAVLHGDGPGDGRLGPGAGLLGAQPARAGAALAGGGAPGHQRPHALRGGEPASGAAALHRADHRPPAPGGHGAAVDAA